MHGSPKMSRWCWFGILLGALFLIPSARAVIVPVYVFTDDYSINQPPGPIVDPVINLGDTIEWRWLADKHSATSVAGSPEVFNSGVLSAGFTFQHTFTHLGTFWYYCLVHGVDNGNGTASGMAGTVTVVPEPASILGLGLAALAAFRVRRRNRS
jgi:hypothetical protein